MTLSWYLKQLLPLSYESRYRTADGHEWFCRWRMWFGYSFAIKRERLSIDPVLEFEVNYPDA